MGQTQPDTALVKQPVNGHLWESREGCLSVQVLQEFFVNATRKIAKPLDAGAAKEIVADFSRWYLHVPGADDVLAAIGSARTGVKWRSSSSRTAWASIPRQVNERHGRPLPGRSRAGHRRAEIVDQLADGLLCVLVTGHAAAGRGEPAEQPQQQQRLVRHPDLPDARLPQSPSSASNSARVMAYALLKPSGPPAAPSLWNHFVPDLDVYLEHVMCSCNASDDNPY
jgi:hypothetical protein